VGWGWLGLRFVFKVTGGQNILTKGCIADRVSLPIPPKCPFPWGIRALAEFTIPWSHPSPHPKWHLDRFSRVSTGHGYVGKVTGGQRILTKCSIAHRVGLPFILSDAAICCRLERRECIYRHLLANCTAWRETALPKACVVE